MDKNNQKEWARREIALISADEKEHDHYEAAYRVYCDMIDKLKEGLDPGFVKTILLRLINDDPLTPITDDENDWTFFEGFDPAINCENPGWSIYQCTRRPTLFKKNIYDRKTGEIDESRYSDTARAVCMDIITNKRYSGGMGEVILDEMIPITMPYFPTGKIKIFTEDFKAYEDAEDFDTFGVLYFKLPNGKMVEVKRFFKKDHETKEMVEIQKQEYLARKKKFEESKKEDDQNGCNDNRITEV